MFMQAAPCHLHPPFSRSCLQWGPALQLFITDRYPTLVLSEPRRLTLSFYSLCRSLFRFLAVSLNGCIDFTNLYSLFILW